MLQQLPLCVQVTLVGPLVRLHILFWNMPQCFIVCCGYLKWKHIGCHAAASVCSCFIWASFMHTWHSVLQGCYPRLRGLLGAWSLMTVISGLFVSQTKPRGCGEWWWGWRLKTTSHGSLKLQWFIFSLGIQSGTLLWQENSDACTATSQESGCLFSRRNITPSCEQPYCMPSWGHYTQVHTHTHVHAPSCWLLYSTYLIVYHCLLTCGLIIYIKVILAIPYSSLWHGGPHSNEQWSQLTSYRWYPTSTCYCYVHHRS